MRRSIIARVGAFVLLVTPLLRADTVEIPSSRDNTAYSEFGLIANATGQHCFAGRNNNGDTRRALLWFDVAGVVPEGSQILSAKISLHLSRTTSGFHTISVHRLTADWGEVGSDPEGEEGGGTGGSPGDATWTHAFYNTVPWAVQGGDFVPTVSASTVVDGVGFYSWISEQTIADVQDMLDDPAGNFGWIVIGDESQEHTTKRFDTRENPNANFWPTLSVTFDPPGASMGACCVVGQTCSVLTPAECAAATGTYQGTGTTCEPIDPCAEATGACCSDSGLCAVTTDAQCRATGGTYQGDGAACDADLCPVVLTPFVDALPIPPVMQPVTGVPGGEAFYQIAATEFTQQLHRDLPSTRVWGYGGSYPAATIEATMDQPVSVEWANDLRDERGNLRDVHLLPVDLCPHGPNHEGPNARTVVHLHGGHVPAIYDGYPTDVTLPGERNLYIYPNHQLPATLWYHDHALGITRLNVYLGLAGFYIVRDAFELELGLPDGAFEIPVVIQDRSFHSDGRFKYPAAWQDHFFGDTLLVNGKVWPYLEVKRGKYRLRLLNGSNSRTLRLAMSNGAPFIQIGTDGGLLPAPVPRSDLLLAPAERADVIVDFDPYAPGTEIILTNSAPAPYPGLPGAGVIPNVMKFIVTADTGTTAPIPTALRPIETLQESDAVQHRDFELRKFPEDCAGSQWLINGLAWDDIVEFPELESTEVWSFINRSGMMHPMHMHLVMFQVLDRQAFEIVDGEIVPVGTPVPPPAHEAGWKDTVRCDPFEITRVIARFEDYTGKFAYHCHILEHEDHEMMRQFQVVVHGDFDDDGDVDLADYAQWSTCQTEPDAGSYPAECGVFDFDADLDIDFADFARLQQVYTGVGP